MIETQIFSIKKNIHYIFIFSIFAYVLDFAYYHPTIGPALTIVSVIVVLILGLLKGLFQFITAITCIFILFDANAKWLYEFQTELFYSILTVKVAGISMYQLLLFITIMLFIIEVVKRKRCLCPGNTSKGVVLTFGFLIFLHLLGALFFQNFDYKITSRYFSSSMFSILSFLIPFMSLSFFKISSMEVHNYLSMVLSASIGKVLSIIALFISGRYIFWGSQIIISRHFYVCMPFLIALFLWKYKKRTYLGALLLLSLIMFEWFRYFQRGLLVQWVYWGFLYIFITTTISKRLVRILKVGTVLILVFTFGFFIAPNIVNQFSSKSIITDKGVLYTNRFFPISQIRELNFKLTESSRFYEIANIFLENRENAYSFFFGKGAGSLFTFSYTLPEGIFNSSGYTRDQIEMNKYYPHSFFNILLLRTGFAGLFIYLIVLFLLLLKLRKIYHFSIKNDNNTYMWYLSLMSLIVWVNVLWGIPVALGSNYGNAVIVGIAIGYYNFCKRKVFI